MLPFLPCFKKDLNCLINLFSVNALENLCCFRKIVFNESLVFHFELNTTFAPSKSNLKKEDQLAWKIAEIASDKAKIDKDAVVMVINRIIDNASVAIASFNRRPVVSASCEYED